MDEPRNHLDYAAPDTEAPGPGRDPMSYYREPPAFGEVVGIFIAAVVLIVSVLAWLSWSIVLKPH